MNRTPPGIDVAKQVFQIHGVDGQGQVVVHGSSLALSQSSDKDKDVLNCHFWLPLQPKQRTVLPELETLCGLSQIVLFESRA